jgi:stage II sporulation protein D
VAAGDDDPVRLLGPALNSIRDGLYRGTIEVIPDGGGLTAINVIDLDPYLKGVVAGEMPSSWPLEALKVQAVAARTYALATRKTTGSFDQYPDTRSQVYKGVVGESASSNAAVDQTAGEILTYAGVPAVTYYFSTSGGHTENVEYSFVGSLSKPWLVGVPDPYDHHSPYHRWQATFSAATLDRALGAPGKFVRLKALQRGVSPRVVRAEVIGTRGRRTVSGPQVRAALGLRDPWFTHVRAASSARRPRSARPASWGPSLRLLAIAGEFRPAPRGRRLAVQRKMGEGWRTVSRERTSRLGRYRAQLEVPGVYRVKAGSVAGPAVRVR